MCGFTGVFKATSAHSSEPDQLEQLYHRGPDARGNWSDESYRISHCRLKIQDLSDQANQPMVCDQSRYVLAYNGEVYNAEVLREELRAVGQEFKTTSDTEVVLYLMVHQGVKSLRKLNGCYSLAFYDSQEEELILARDPMGIKPLYIRDGEDGSLHFASEYQALKRDSDVWNEQKMADYLQMGFTGLESLVEGVRSLDPRFPLVRRTKSGKIARTYDQVPVSKDRDLLGILRSAVHDRLISDVPLGSFLSGGIDSSTISALAIEAHPGLKTFSLGFSDGGLLDERDAARQVADHIGSDHHELELSEDDLLNSIDDWIGSLDLPFGDASALAVYHLSRFARQQVTVALSGDGADELFAGYNRHRAFLRASREKPLWKVLSRNAAAVRNLTQASQTRETRNGLRAYRLQKFLSLQRLSPAERYGFLTRFVSPQRCSMVYSHPGTPMDSGVQDLRSYLTMDQRLVLREDMLVKVDRMSMAHSLEVRVPFLDPRVISYAAQLPENELIRQGMGKWALRESVRPLLPASMLSGPKRGFEIPMQRWLSGPLSGEVDEYLHPDRFSSDAGWKKEGLARLRREFAAKPSPELTHLVWNLWVLKRWEARN